MTRGPKTHGRSRTSEYMIWSSMKRRCMKPSAADFARYGGRGVTVCESWLTFDGFFADMGMKPSAQHSLERIDNDLGYEPGNCRWATRIEQSNNKRTNHLVEYRGSIMSIADAVRAAGSLVSRETARNRISRGWSALDAVETPNTYRRDPVTRKVILMESAE